MTFDPNSTRRGADGADPQRPGTVAVGEQLAAAVDQAVLARAQQEAAAMAEDAFEEILTPELSTALQCQGCRPHADPRTCVGGCR